MVQLFDPCACCCTSEDTHVFSGFTLRDSFKAYSSAIHSILNPFLTFEACYLAVARISAKSIFCNILTQFDPLRLCLFRLDP